MINSLLTFTLMPGRRDEFVDTFRRLEVLAVSSWQPGYLGGQLQLDLDDPDTAIVLASWESRDAYQGWLDNPEREPIGDQLRPYCSVEPMGRVCEIAQAVAPETRVGRA